MKIKMYFTDAEIMALVSGKSLLVKIPANKIVCRSKDTNSYGDVVVCDASVSKYGCTGTVRMCDIEMLSLAPHLNCYVQAFRAAGVLVNQQLTTVVGYY